MNKKIKKWCNKDLAEYFENVPLNVFSAFADKGGIQNGCDIDVVFPHVESTSSLIEIGACYGRVIDHLLRKGYKGKIYAIERSRKYFEILKEKYVNINSKKALEIINSDINNFTPSHKVDAILWMWSDISSFAKDEQLKILRELSNWLTDQGVLIVETLDHTQTSMNATHAQTSEKDGQTYTIESEYGNLYGYIPTANEVKKYGISLGFEQVEQMHYLTSTSRKRIINIFKRKIQSKSIETHSYATV